MFGRLLLQVVFLSLNLQLTVTVNFWLFKTKGLLVVAVLY
jgi:hypothetical protein